jgi:hypothetical protein
MAKVLEKETTRSEVLIPLINRTLLKNNILDLHTEHGREWLAMCAENGDKWAAEFLESHLALRRNRSLIRFLGGNELEDHDHEELVKAAEEGDTTAMTILGRRLLIGDGLEQNTKEGRRWLTKAAEEGGTYTYGRWSVRCWWILFVTFKILSKTNPIWLRGLYLVAYLLSVFLFVVAVGWAFASLFGLVLPE